MIPAGELFGSLRAAGLEFFAGVPDSVLKHLTNYFSQLEPSSHIVTANEGSAIALAAGVHLASGKTPLVYMQNSGLGNCVNPLLSLASQEVYGIPLILLIGWRGAPERPDEPQHRHQGRITPTLLDTLGIPYRVLDEIGFDESIRWTVQECKRLSSPAALLVPYGSLAEELKPEKSVAPDRPTRAEVLRVLLQLFPNDVLIGTTGKTGRELYQLRKESGSQSPLDFLNVGAMGHTSQIGLGIALERPDKQVVCIDGDGSVLMHTGNLACIGHLAPRNFKHILLNNGKHESVGMPGCMQSAHRLR